MTQLTRRSLLRQAPVGAAAFGLLPAMPALAAIGRSPAAVPRLPAKATGSMMVHIKDLAAGEMTLLVGSREIVVRNPRLVADLATAAHSGENA
jgi:hypothetical protein